MSTVRSANPPDIPRLARLTQRDAGWIRRTTAGLNHRNATILVAERRDQVLGFCALWITRRGQRPGTGPLGTLGRRLPAPAGRESDSILQPLRLGQIGDIYVVPAVRRQGVGRALIQASTRWLKSRHVTEIQAAVEPQDAAVQNFFCQLGLEPGAVLVRTKLGRQKRLCGTEIRSATQQDLPQLSRLVRREVEYQQQLARSFQLVSPVDWERYTGTLLRRREASILVANRKGHLAGYIDVRIVEAGRHHVALRLRSQLRRVRRHLQKAAALPAPKARRYGYIEDIYVEPEVRHTGLGTGLFECSLAWFEEQGIQEIEATIWATNEASRTFFQKLGFDTIRLMMRKRLNATGR